MDIHWHWQHLLNHLSDLGFDIQRDNNGQIVIYTGLTKDNFRGRIVEVLMKDRIRGYQLFHCPKCDKETRHLFSVWFDEPQKNVNVCLTCHDNHPEMEEETFYVS